MKKIIILIFIFSTVKNVVAQTGIGTTTPVNKFQVETAVAAAATTGTAMNGNLRLGVVGANQIVDFGLGTTYSWIQSRDKTNYATNYSLLLNPNGGNIGIGTTNPTAKLNLVGGGIRIHDGFSNATARPAINTASVGSYEIRAVGSTGGSTQADAGDDGFIRLSAGGGTNANMQASIDITGYSTLADMNNNIVMRTSGTERFRIDVSGNTSLSGNITGNNSSTSTIAGFAANMNAQTGTTYTLAASDNGKIITLDNASAISLIVPSTLFAGFNCMIVQLNNGQVTISGSGTTISNRSSFTKTGGKNAIVTILAISATNFISSGDMSN